MDVDIWAWVGDTQQQLSEAGKGGLAIAQQAEALELPWLEFYARYWHLMGRIGDRAQGAVAVADAQQLLAFAQREDVRECPSVPAAVEALAIAWANADGPGHATERLE